MRRNPAHSSSEGHAYILSKTFMSAQLIDSILSLDSMSNSKEILLRRLEFINIKKGWGVGGRNPEGLGWSCTFFFQTHSTSYLSHFHPLLITTSWFTYHLIKRILHLNQDHIFDGSSASLLAASTCH